MDELVDSLTQVVDKQRAVINDTFDEECSSPTMNEIEGPGGSLEQGGVIAKIMKIQEKLNQIDSNEENIIDRYKVAVKESRDSTLKINTENEALRALVRDIRNKFEDLQEKEAQYKASEENQMNYVELLQKFDAMQTNFSYLEDYFKAGSATEDAAELVALYKSYIY